MESGSVEGEAIGDVLIDDSMIFEDVGIEGALVESENVGYLETFMHVFKEAGFDVQDFIYDKWSNRGIMGNRTDLTLEILMPDGSDNSGIGNYMCVCSPDEENYHKGKFSIYLVVKFNEEFGDVPEYISIPNAVLQESRYLGKMESHFAEILGYLVCYYPMDENGYGVTMDSDGEVLGFYKDEVMDNPLKTVIDKGRMDVSDIRAIVERVAFDHADYLIGKKWSVNYRCMEE